MLTKQSDTSLPVSAILCAAGMSRRMGPQNKLLLPYNGQLLIGHMISELLKSKINELIIVLGHEAEKIKNEISSSDPRINIVFNENFEQGHTSSIQAGLAAISVDTNAFMICLSDMPLLTGQHYDELLTRWQTMDKSQEYILRPLIYQTPGHPVMMSREFLPEVMALQHDDRCQKVILRHTDQLVTLSTDDFAFIKDIDTPEQYSNLSSNS